MGIQISDKVQREAEISYALSILRAHGAKVMKGEDITEWQGRWLVVDLPFEVYFAFQKYEHDMRGE